MKILLPLKSEFYLMIELEKKTEEYRAIAPHWITRLVKKPFVDFLKESFGITWRRNERNENLVSGLKELIRLNGANAVFKDVDSIVFSYGYTKRHMQWKCDALDIGYGSPVWGAEEGREYFVFKLGRRLA
nr:MAG TPA: hypothetical protein [Caudoviricetes sp.]